MAEWRAQDHRNGIKHSTGCGSCTYEARLAQLIAEAEPYREGQPRFPSHLRDLRHVYGVDVRWSKARDHDDGLMHPTGCSACVWKRAQLLKSGEWTQPARQQGTNHAWVVYFIREGAAGPIKIGQAADPAKRLAGFQTSHSKQLTILATTTGYREGVLHKHFAHLRIRPRGEWFEPAPELLAFIEGLS